MNNYDILIIGAGPIGMACGIEAQRAGMSYVIVEKGALVNSLFNYPVFMNFFSTSRKLEIGGVPFTSINPKPNRNEAVEYYRRVAEKFALNIRLFERVEAVKKEESISGTIFRVDTSKGQYQVKKVIIATGFYDIPLLMGIPGEDLPQVTHYYKDPHLYAFQRVVVVGANNSAIDAALETYRKGAQVTLVIRGGEIGSYVKYWVRPDIENRIKEGEIKVYFHTELTAIRNGEVTIRTPEGELILDNDFVIAMTGYQPDFRMLEQLGVQLADTPKHEPAYHTDTMETVLPGLYLAGVVCGGRDTHQWFIENSRVHAEQIIRHIAAQIR